LTRLDRGVAFNGATPGIAGVEGISGAHVQDLAEKLKGSRAISI
jgi:hypothetical protein